MGRWVAAPLPRAGGEVLRAAEGPGGAGALAGRRKWAALPRRLGLTTHLPSPCPPLPRPAVGPAGASRPFPWVLLSFPGLGGRAASGPRGGVGRGVASAPPVCPGRLSGLAGLVLLFASQNVPMHFPGHE